MKGSTSGLASQCREVPIGGIGSKTTSAAPTYFFCCTPTSVWILTGVTTNWGFFDGERHIVCLKNVDIEKSPHYPKNQRDDMIRA